MSVYLMETGDHIVARIDADGWHDAIDKARRIARKRCVFDFKLSVSTGRKFTASGHVPRPNKYGRILCLGELSNQTGREAAE